MLNLTDLPERKLSEFSARHQRIPVSRFWKKETATAQAAAAEKLASKPECALLPGVLYQN